MGSGSTRLKKKSFKFVIKNKDQKVVLYLVLQINSFFSPPVILKKT